MYSESPQARSNKDISRLLRTHGIAPTRQRLAIARCLLSQPQHLSAEQVLARTDLKVSKATVYNTLGLFASKGLIRELSVDSSRAFYDSSTHPHCHYYDPETQELKDIPMDKLNLELKAPLPDGTEIDRMDVIIHLRAKHSD